MAFGGNLDSGTTLMSTGLMERRVCVQTVFATWSALRVGVHPLNVQDNDEDDEDDEDEDDEDEDDEDDDATTERMLVALAGAFARAGTESSVTVTSSPFSPFSG